MQDTILLPTVPKIVEEEKNKAVIEIEGLHPGYGVTIGNALRRVLLASLPGAAVTSVKIENVNHEFSTLPGVLEDALTILLNIKQLRFKIFSDEPRVLTLSVNGEKIATSADLKIPSDVEVVNPEQSIATLTDKSSSLQIELTVEKGVGYVKRETINREKLEVGVMTLDAIFTPVRKASYEIENMRVGTATNYNRLRFLIETDGSITPKEAFLKALSILQEQLKRLESFEEISKIIDESPMPEFVPTEEGVDDEQTAQDEESMDVMKIKIEDLKLSSRTINALSRSNIRTIGGLTKKSSEDLLSLEGVGERALQEIQRALGNLGLTLPSD
ncbi:DNA-directed RNA polymerase subunit alpha [Patescibacteria group bacterium]